MRWLRVLAVAPWLAVTSAVLASAVLAGVTAPPQWLLVASVGAIFGLLILRMGVLAAIRRGRERTALLAMIGALVLWAAGSALLNDGADLQSIQFPSVSEAFFIPSYLLLAAHLLLAARDDGNRATGSVLEAVIVTGGGVCLLGLLLVTPLAGVFDVRGSTLVLALLYPLLDIVLAATVVSQVVLRRRAAGPAAAGLVAGFACLCGADLMLVVSLSDGTYTSGLVSQGLYGLGFTLLGTAACARPLDVRGTAGTGRHVVVVAAAAVALAVLALRPVTAGAWYLTLPAILTLVVAGARLAVALQEARGAREARRLSLTDDLTGLDNRRSVLARLERDIENGRPLGLLLFDLDAFKEVNDSLGHSAGDAVLREVARRLAGVVPGDALTARLGGDEFAVVTGQDDEESLSHLGRACLDALATPVQADDLEITVRASVGVAVRREGDARASDLLRRADVAMYEAKETRAGVLVYDSARDLFTRERLQMAEQLRAAVSDGQLTVWYQPQVDTRTLLVSGMEALVRWQHPTLGMIPPLDFLPVARRAGLMPALTEAVMRRVVLDAAGWVEEGLRLRVSFNCAPPELLSSTLLPRLFSAIADARLPPDTLLIEVTEDSFVADPELARSVLERLRAHHVQTAIDDYGTGFSSLKYLRDLPVQELKIDRAFVSSMTSDTRSRVIVDSTRQMAHAMGLRLVAEGVEDVATADVLTALDIDVLQGFHIARPMPVDQVLPWIRAWQDDALQRVAARVPRQVDGTGDVTRRAVAPAP